MQIGVISDTHAQSLSELPARLIQALSEVDLVIHCGDFTGGDVLEGLKRLKEVKAVRGNMDSLELRLLLPEKDVLQIQGRKIGITHGYGAPVGAEQRVRRSFDNVDIIVYGHTHMSQNKVIRGILFFNPGPGRRSYGILDIGEQVQGRIVKL